MAGLPRSKIALGLPLVALALCLASKAVADSPGETVTLGEVIDGETLRLTDGREVRLAAISVPRGDRDGKLAERARETVVQAAAKGPLGLVFDERRKNRYGQLLAQVRVRRPEGQDIWLQALLLSKGLARVRGLPENRRAVAALLAVEREARAAGRGLWAYRRFAVLSPVQAARHIGSFQIVEGRVLATATVKGRSYLNFGEDWKSDFTVTLDRAARRRFEKSGLDPLSFEGRRVRVRGWLKSFNGPMIELGYPEPIELLDTEEPN